MQWQPFQSYLLTTKAPIYFQCSALSASEHQSVLSVSLCTHVLSAHAWTCSGQPSIVSLNLVFRANDNNNFAAYILLHELWVYLCLPRWTFSRCQHGCTMEILSAGILKNCLHTHYNVCSSTKCTYMCVHTAHGTMCMCIAGASVQDDGRGRLRR